MTQEKWIRFLTQRLVQRRHEALGWYHGMLELVTALNHKLRQYILLGRRGQLTVLAVHHFTCVNLCGVLARTALFARKQTCKPFHFFKLFLDNRTE